MNTSEPAAPAILIVDDMPQNIEVLGGVLDPHYKVRAATSGPRALVIAAKDPQPDLILLDIMMPDMDGLEVCRRLKADLRTRNVPVIFVTAMDEVDDEARGFDVGGVDYITKPISPPTVLARVRTHLALSNQSRELDRQVRERTQELKETRLDIIRCLGKAAEFKDDNTGLHVVRMSHYARILAIGAGLTDRDADLIFDAAPMHDVGKIGIPDGILKKPARLEPAEWEIMQEHVMYGVEILSGPSSELLDMARTIALSHHEHWDGKGYPKGIAGGAIPLAGRIVAIADVFDALTSVRPYKKAWTPEEAVDLIRKNAGTHFDPALVGIMDTVLAQFDEVRLRYRDASESS
jgi:putative two-component system response regulator